MRDSADAAKVADGHSVAAVGVHDRPHLARFVRARGCINLAPLLVALTRGGRFYLMHQTSTSYDARIRFGGIDRRRILFSAQILWVILLDSSR